MSIHQIIYTSCAMGIEGGNGQQIFSYDRNMTNDVLIIMRGMLSYNKPRLDYNDINNVPQAFTYRRLTNGMCAVSLGTYLGQDYVGHRQGNFIVHAVAGDESNFTSYPCEYYGGKTLMSEAPNEVRHNKKPKLLDEPKLRSGKCVNYKNIEAFLRTDNRNAMFSEILTALLKFGSAQKRVLICDNATNTILWIAALHYTLPIEIALNVSFTSYEYSPDLSMSRVCGVILQGTAYNRNDANKHFTFDFINNLFPEGLLRSDESAVHFHDFMKNSLCNDRDSLNRFHEFIRTKLTYRTADEEYYNVYSLFRLFTEKLDNISLSILIDAVRAWEKYAIEDIRYEIVYRLLESCETILSAPEEYFNEAIDVIFANLDSIPVAKASQIQGIFKTLIADRVIAMLRSETNEQMFRVSYDKIFHQCHENRISLYKELKRDAYPEKLLAVLINSIDNDIGWRILFIKTLICEVMRH